MLHLQTDVTQWKQSRHTYKEKRGVGHRGLERTKRREEHKKRRIKQNNN